VNLPARAVIIRGTTHWGSSGLSELTTSDVMQMIGRAGRPQFDKDGVAVIMTTYESAARYNQLLKGQLIESHLLERIIEHLNAEVVAAGMATELSCLKWLKLTYMFTRMKKAPLKFFRQHLSPLQIEGKLQEICKNNVDQLLHAVSYTAIVSEWTKRVRPELNANASVARVAYSVSAEHAVEGE